MKKILTLVLALALLIPATGLAFNETGYPICDDVITITVSGANSGTTDWNDTNMVAEIEKRLGIKLECTSFEADIWSTQFTLMLASEELPDIVINPGITLSEVSNYGAQGYFLDMSEYIEKYAPNIQAAMEKFPTYRNYVTSPDGGIYTLCTATENIIALVPRTWLNKTWMDNLGLSYPTTLDELHDVLVAFKEQDANGNGDATDEIPLSNNVEYTCSAFLNAFGFDTRATGYLLQADENGKVYLGETTDAYKAYLTYMNGLWNEGLIDVDFFVQSGDEFRAKAAEDKLGMYGDSAPFVAASKDISYDSNFYWIGALTGEYRDTATIVTNPAVYTTAEIVVNAETEYPAEIVRLLDYYFTEEGSLAGAYGYEGVDWDLNYLTIPGLEEFGVATMYQPEGFSSGEEYRYKKAIINEAFKMIVPIVNTQYDAMLQADEAQLEAMVPEYGWAVQFVRQGMNREGVQLVERFPTLLYTEAESTERTQLYTDIQLYLSNMQAQFITGQVGIEDGWDEFLAQLKTMQLDRLLEIEQAAYDRLMGA
ncbi:MAG: extracellular solute-binding protein [Eubacteriales bacterium]|nr:extracellular solute-binding protein [Eubacteriales bacterium]